ncbi:MAG: hypothetical protein K9G61_01530 [Bacteroidales bacterium]|nr:hypothetical protein [Bacteroidales bacterium]
MKMIRLNEVQRAIKMVAGVSLFVTGVLLTGGCKKDTNKAPDFETQTPGLKTTSERLLIQRINSFQVASAQLQTGNYEKNGSRLSIDSALYLIGTTIKFTYCFPTSIYNKAIWDTTFISLPVDPQLEDVLYTDAVSSYNNCVDSVRAKYRAIIDTTKKLIGVVIQDLGTGSSLNRDIRVIAQFGTGNSTTSLLDGNSRFDESDAYYYQDGSYRCDGTFPGEGATDILESEVLFKYLPVPVPGYHVWFEAGGLPYTPNYYDFEGDGNIDNYCDYKIYYANSSVGSITSETECLEYDQGNSGIHEMDFYLQGADDIVAHWLEYNNPNSKSFETCSFIDWSNPPSTEIMHILQFTFSIKHITPITGGTGTYPIPID